MAYQSKNLSALGYANGPEEWRAVDGLSVSSHGRVRNSRGRVLKGDWPNGYHRVRLGQNGRAESFFVHHLVCAAFHGERPSPSNCALHRDDDKSNNTPGNLYWGTHKQNASDRYFNGRSRAKLSSRAVQIIRFEYENALARSGGRRAAAGTFNRLAAIFKVSPEVARNAVRSYALES